LQKFVYRTPLANGLVDGVKCCQQLVYSYGG